MTKLGINTQRAIRQYKTFEKNPQKKSTFGRIYKLVEHNSTKLNGRQKIGLSIKMTSSYLNGSRDYDTIIRKLPEISGYTGTSHEWFKQLQHRPKVFMGAIEKKPIYLKTINKWAKFAKVK